MYYFQVNDRTQTTSLKRTQGSDVDRGHVVFESLTGINLKFIYRKLNYKKGSIFPKEPQLPQDQPNQAEHQNLASAIVKHQNRHRQPRFLSRSQARETHPLRWRSRCQDLRTGSARWPDRRMMAGRRLFRSSWLLRWVRRRWCSSPRR